MSNFVKFVSVVALVGSLAPFAAQARAGDFRNSAAPAIHAVQAQNNGAFVAGRGSENARFADNAKSFNNRGTVARVAYAYNQEPVSQRWVGGAATDSYGG
ncbi:MAG: hypothetical protein KGJ73_04255 [Rhodospirillales bacterium]|nr:hypothetical protein [Rhodospirillales bacterium]